MGRFVGHIETKCCFQGDEDNERNAYFRIIDFIGSMKLIKYALFKQE